MPPNSPSLYEILAVKPGATKPEIDEAYLRRKSAGLDSKALWEVERAYVTLSNPNLKRKYDADLLDSAARERLRAVDLVMAEESPRPQASSQSGSAPRFSRGALLAVLAVAFLVVVLAVVRPFVSPHLVHYRAGTELVHRATGAPFGRVVASESDHRFPNGIVADAYRVLLPGSEERWLTRQEVNRIARPR